MKLAVLLAGCAALASCATPEFTRPDVAVPAAWRSAPANERSLADLPWGALFRTPELQALIREALANNSDLRIAAERVEAARAQFGIQRSYLFPGASANASASRARQPGSADSNTIMESASVGLAMPTWELDLWGRLRSLTDAAYRTTMASEEARRGYEASLVAQVALGFVDLLDADGQLEIALRTRATREESLRLMRLRFASETVSVVDVRQAESLLAGADATVADLERRRTQGENYLSVLVGRDPGPIARPAGFAGFSVPPNLPAGIPSQLVERRPDVRAAEQTLAAMSANVDAARKAFLPTISLTGFLGFVSPELAALFDGGRYAWSVTPAVTLPIFTAGRLSSAVDYATAQQRIALEQYRQSIRTALQEVDDALVAHQRLREQLDAQIRVAGADRDRLRLTRLRYDAGVSSYFEVLDSERQSFASDLGVVQTTRALYSSVVQLYRALGGGWEPPHPG